MNKNEIMIEVDRLLQSWELYSTENRTYIKKIFNGLNRFDMMLNIDVMDKQAKIYMLERGDQIYEYRTESVEVVKYAILRDVIEIVTHVFIYDTYADEKRRLHFTDNIRNHSKQVVDDAFLKMGEPYNKWNNMGITIWNFKDNEDKLRS